MTPTRQFQETPRTILYYPTISVPTGEWLRYAVLYWDEVSSIVPMEYDPKEPKAIIDYSPDIRLLESEGVFRPINPEMLVRKQRWEKLKCFENEIKDRIESQSFQRGLPPEDIRRRKQNYDYRLLEQGADPIWLTFRIHHDKVSDLLLEFLEDEGLAIGEYPWLYCERRTALLYMSVLAKYLADIDSDYTVPGTDNSRYQKMVFETDSEKDGFPGLSINMQNLIPVPREDVPFSKIIKFKQKRKDELIQFRLFLSEFQEDLASCEREPDIRRTVVDYQERLVQGVRSLERTMKEEKGSLVMGSVKTLLGIGNPLLWKLATENIAILQNLPVELQTVGVGVSTAVSIGALLINNRNKQRALLRESPFAYYYHARRNRLI
jgi:hypothetical protein